MTVLLVIVYLAAITAANLAVAWFGPAAAPWIALVLIGLDLTCRDVLHDRWTHGRTWKMAGLILGGSAASWGINQVALDIPNVGRVAAASAVSFLLASSADWLVYQLAQRRPWWQRVNGSNVVGALVDSLAFLPLAFGQVLPGPMAGQFVAKVAGGFGWSLLLARLRRPVVERA